MLRQKPDRRETRTAKNNKGTIFFKKIYRDMLQNKKKYIS